MAFAVTPGDYLVEVEHERVDGSTYWHTREVVAFDHGTPLVVGDGSYCNRLVPVGHLGHAKRWRLNAATAQATVTPAAPGWYALYAVYDEDGGGSPDFERAPVLAWRASLGEYGGSATVLDFDGVGDLRPVDAVERVQRRVERIGFFDKLLGFFHPELFPEPPEPAEVVKNGCLAGLRCNPGRYEEVEP